MPSGYTHILLAQTFPKESKLHESNLGLLLSSNMKYFQLGALGPDLPYSKQAALVKRDQFKIADKFHYINTSALPNLAMKKTKLLSGDELDQAFAFFLGYMSHFIADGIIHPFVRDKVGEYEENKDAHRILEMKIDVLLMAHISKKSGHKINLNNTNLHEQISDPISKKFVHISKIFSESITEIYGDKIECEDILDWIKGLQRLFAIAESNDNRFYSDVPLVNGYLFKDIDDLKNSAEEVLFLGKNSAKDRPINFLGRDVHFFTDCLPQYYEAFRGIALKAYEYVYNDGPPIGNLEMPSINLDTGRALAIADGKDLNQKAQYWSV